MEMTIDDTLTGLYALREFLKYSEFEGLEEQTKVQIQIVTDAIDTMCKYQTMQEVLEKVWNVPSCMLDEAECLNEIMETYRTVR